MPDAMASEAQQRHAALPSDKEHETCAHVDARVAADAADLPSTLDETTRTAKSYLRQLNVPRDLVLPSGWSMRDKCSCLEVSFDAYTVEYTSIGRNDNEAAAIRANAAIPLAVGVFYFEVTVLAKGIHGYFGIGICGPHVLLTRLPGWERESFGYHGDDGHFFANSGSGTAYGPTYQEGDVVGCGLNTMTGDLFFTKNGVFLGVAAVVQLLDASGDNSNNNAGLAGPSSTILPPPSSTTMEGGEASSTTTSINGSLNWDPRDAASLPAALFRPFYPAIGMRSLGERLWTNFGQKPFLFAIGGYVELQKRDIYGQVLAQAFSPHRRAADPISTSVLDTLVLDYFMHNGLLQSARAFFRAIHAKSARRSALGCVADDEQRRLLELDFDARWRKIHHRAVLKELILAGNFDAAEEHMRLFYAALVQPGVSSSLHHTLRLESFIERIKAVLVHQGSLEDLFFEIGSYFSDKMSLLSESEKLLLSQIFSLSAFPDPSNCPLSHLLHSSRRAKTLDFILESIAQREGIRMDSQLQFLPKHLATIFSVLAHVGSPYAAFIDPSKDFFRKSL